MTSINAACSIQSRRSAWGRMLTPVTYERQREHFPFEDRIPVLAKRSTVAENANVYYLCGLRMSEHTNPSLDRFQQLYVEHHRWLQTWLLRRLGCHANAADLAQDTFVRTLKSPLLGTIDEPRAFLCLIAKRVLCSFWRRRELERAYLDALAELPTAEVPSEEAFALLREAIMAVDQMLDGLPDKIRHAFLLNRLEGMTHPEIARELKVSVATVERWIKRAVTQCYLANLGLEG